MAGAKAAGDAERQGGEGRLERGQMIDAWSTALTSSCSVLE